MSAIGVLPQEQRPVHRPVHVPDVVADLGESAPGLRVRGNSLQFLQRHAVGALAPARTRHPADEDCRRRLIPTGARIGDHGVDLIEAQHPALAVVPLLEARREELGQLPGFPLRLHLPGGRVRVGRLPGQRAGAHHPQDKHSKRRGAPAAGASRHRARSAPVPGRSSDGAGRRAGVFDRRPGSGRRCARGGRTPVRPPARAVSECARPRRCPGGCPAAGPRRGRSSQERHGPRKGRLGTPPPDRAGGRGNRSIIDRRVAPRGG